MEAGSGPYNPRTVEEVFRDFNGRRAGMIKALTTDVEEFYSQCDPGSRKSLLNVFRDGICHPKMALVIDDHLKVWEEKGQPRVHVVPAFAPYYAPQAETNNAFPMLYVARNVACDVRGGFFKEFDEGLLLRISDVFYEDDMAGLQK